MLPLSLELSRLRVALIGNGAPALRRLAWLDEAGAVGLRVFAAAPSPELADAAGERLVRAWPGAAALRRTQLIFIADVPAPKRRLLAQAARRAGAILHVEDAPSLSDAQAPAVLRRGDLTLAVSTCGSAPGLAAELKDFLAGVIGPEWRGRLDRIAALRREWQETGADHATVRRLTAAQIGRYGWLKLHPVAVSANDRGIEKRDQQEEVCHDAETRRRRP